MKIINLLRFWRRRVLTTCADKLANGGPELHILDVLADILGASSMIDKHLSNQLWISLLYSCFCSEHEVRKSLTDNPFRCDQLSN